MVSFIVPTISYGDLAVNTRMFVLSSSNNVTVSVVDMVSKYTELLKSIFDFNEINELLSGAKYFRPFGILIDCNGGAGGAYAKRIFEVELGAGSSVVNHQPSNHPEALHPSKVGSLHIESEMKSTTKIDFGATLDTDGSRVILYGQRGFHIPAGETIAIITSHYPMIPYFQTNSFKGVSRTYFTTSSVDDVIQEGPLKLKKAPGSWLHFNSLMKNECVLICEDENYGVGSKHVGCSDGIWTILAWLTMVIHLYQPVTNILTDHWTEYGRCFLTVYEFHHIGSEIMSNFMRNLKFKIFPTEGFVGTTYTFDHKSYTVIEAGSMIFQGHVGPEVGFEDGTLRIRVEPKGLILFTTVSVNGEGTIRIIAEVQTKEIPHNSNKLRVTLPLLKLAMAVSKIECITKKTYPDLVY
uniref:Phosphoglucomutase-1 n=1 Tax=Lygus hesperus TaxID=30085 RepID=A0A0A9YD69_LYGHE